jgi:hypothetical protein
VGLVKHFETAMIACGFDKIFYHAKNSNSFNLLLEKMGYSVAEVIYAKVIKGQA